MHATEGHYQLHSATISPPPPPHHHIIFIFIFIFVDVVSMAPKKKTKKKSGGASDGAATDDPSMFDNTPPLVIAPEVVHYVTLDMRLLNWSYLNFKLRTKTTTRLFAIKQQIQKHHGPISDLKICKGHFSEANEMLNDMDTLQDYGIEGAPDSDPEMISIIHYDFKPQQHDNPLLLATEQQ